MAQQIPLSPAFSGGARRHLPLLLLLFAGSGCSALIYEIVWYQLLQLVIGSTAVSLGVLLATFMGGLCLGSLLLPRLKLGGQHPLRVYGKLELGIGACGILVLFLMPLVDSVYTSAVGHGMPAILLRALVSALCLLPPTFLMGASLPAASRWIKASPEGVGWLGMLYGANTVGAVFGCLLAGFYLLRVFDMATATFVAAAINVAVGLVSFALAKRAPEHKPADEARPAIAAGAWPVYVTIALSGATALGAEVIWTRLLGLMLGATVYTFSIILAVFLVGLGIGSTGGSMLARGRAESQGAARLEPDAAGRRGGLDRVHAVAIRCPTGRSIRCFPPARGTRSRSTWCAACGRCCRRRCCGARAFRWRWRRRRAKRATPGGWWAASTRPTPAARFWARCASA